MTGRNLRIPTAEVLWFEGNHYDLVEKYIGVGNPAVGVFLRNKSGEIIAEGAEYCFGNMKTALGGIGRSSVMDHPMHTSLCIAPSLVFSPHPHHFAFRLYYPPDGPVTEMRLRISLGKFTEEELKNAGKLYPDIKLGHLKDGKFVE